MRSSEIQDHFYLREAPQHVGDDDWRLSSAQINKEYLGKLMKGSTAHLEDLGTHNGLQLYRYRKEVFAVHPDRQTNRLVYWVKIEIQDEKDLGVKTVTQRAVWRDRNTVKTVGLPAYIFWELWLKQYHYIATDTMQTSDGKTFWNLRVSEAFAKGLNVYLFDKSQDPQKLVKFIDLNEFDQYDQAGKIWGLTIEYQKRRLIMTDRDLHPASDVECEF